MWLNGGWTLFSQEFEIELEGSQTLRLLCYSKVKQCRDDGENMDRIMAKGQIQVYLLIWYFII